MAILIVVTSSEQTRRNMEKALVEAPDLFVSKPVPNVYLMRSNGLALWYAWKEKRKSPLYIDVFLSDELHEWQVSDEVRRSVEWKIENKFSSYPVSKEKLRDHALASREDLQKIGLDFSIT